MKQARAAFAMCAVLPALTCTARGGSMPPDLLGQEASDQYGRVVASVGDVSDDGIPDFAISAPLHDENLQANRGKVYIYSGATFHLLGDPLLGEHGGDQFGLAIAAANVVGDARNELIIGAPFFDQGTLTDAGRVYVYGFSGGLWTLLGAKSGLYKGEEFGWSLADGIHISGSFDKFVVGAPFNDLAGTNAGRVVVYSFGAMGISQFRQLLGQKAGDRFGFAVARVGRANPDSQDDFVVGAPHNDDTGTNAGKTYLYSGNSIMMPGTPTPMSVRRGANPGDQFGRVVAGVGDVNGGGRFDYAVGAPFLATAAGADAGRVYVISGANGSTLWAKAGTPGDRLGSSIAGGQVFMNGDGHPDVLIGASRNSTNGVNAGVFYVRSGIDGMLLEPPTLGPDAGDLFGFSVAMLPSLDGDDLAELLIGSPGWDAGPAVDVGRAFLVLSTAPLPAGSQAGDAGGATGDGLVNPDDVAAVIGAWGPCGAAHCPQDVNHDGSVDGDDLLAVIARLEAG